MAQLARTIENVESRIAKVTDTLPSLPTVLWGYVPTWDQYIITGMYTYLS
jgi:ABC-type Fe3+-hydroxamate transport system substrate-binding protein